MKVQEARIAAIRPEATPSLRQYVTDQTHQLSIAGKIPENLDLSITNTITIKSGATLNAVPLSTSKGLSDTQRLEIEKSFVTLSNATLPLIKKYYPQATGAIDGFEVVLATKTAFDAWADPENQTMIKPLIKTTRALVELTDVVKVMVPALNQVPYLEAAGVIIKIGDSLYQFYTDFSKTTAKPVDKQAS